MTTNNPTRRRILQLLTAAAVTGVAGCSSPDTPSGAGTPAPTQTDQASAPDDESGDYGDHHEEANEHHEEAVEHHEEAVEHHDEPETEHDHEGGHDEVGPPTDHAEVAMITQNGTYHFAPHVVRVNVGGKVTFRNESGVHATAAYHPENDRPQLMPDGAASWESPLFSDAGAEFEHTFETEGVYHYYCEPHEQLGMIGSVIVGDPDPHDQPALQDPPAELSDNVRHTLETLNERCNEALGHTH